MVSLAYKNYHSVFARKLLFSVFERPHPKFFLLFFYFFIIEVYASYIMALVGVKLETLISQPDALTTSPPSINATFKNSPAISFNLLSFLNSFFFFFNTVHRLSPCRQLIAEQTLKPCLKSDIKLNAGPVNLIITR